MVVLITVWSNLKHAPLDINDDYMMELMMVMLMMTTDEDLLIIKNAFERVCNCIKQLDEFTVRGHLYF